jgi:hypothetical protein
MYEGFWKKLMSYTPFGEEEEMPQPKAMTEAPAIPDSTGLMIRRSRQRAEQKKAELSERLMTPSGIDTADKIKMYMDAIKEANARRDAERGFPSPPPRPNFAATKLVELIDQRESSGDYNALLGHSQKGKFSNIKVSNMTIGELKEFGKEYARWSREYKRRNPQYGSSKVASTPMGRYQFVLTTLLENAQKMGLDDDTVFSPEVQDRMFDYEVRKRLDPFTDPDQRRSSIRSGWVGLDKVNDRILDYAIQNYLGL